MRCEDLCSPEYHLRLIEDTEPRLDCIDIATLPSIALFLGQKVVERPDISRDCYIVYDSAGNSVVVSKTRDVGTRDCVLVDSLGPIARDCSPVFRRLDRESLRLLTEFLGLETVSSKGLFNPYQEELVVIDEESIIKIPSMTALPEDRLEKDRAPRTGEGVAESTRASVDRSGSVRLRLGDVLLEISSSNTVFRRCYRSGGLDICTGDQGYVYIDDRERIVFRGPRDSLLSVRHNIGSLSRIVYSQPLGYFIEEIQQGIEIRNWWAVSLDRYGTRGLAVSSYPYIHIEVGEREAVLRTPSGSVAMALGPDIETLSPWTLSQLSLEPIETEAVPRDTRPLLEIHPRKILLQDVLVRDDRLLLFLVNSLDKSFSSSVIFAGYIAGSYAMYRRGVWEEVSTLFNRIDLSVPAHRLVVVRVDKYERRPPRLRIRTSRP